MIFYNCAPVLSIRFRLRLVDVLANLAGGPLRNNAVRCLNDAKELTPCPTVAVARQGPVKQRDSMRLQVLRHVVQVVRAIFSQNLYYTVQISPRCLLEQLRICQVLALLLQRLCQVPLGSLKSVCGCPTRLESAFEAFSEAFSSELINQDWSALHRELREVLTLLGQADRDCSRSLQSCKYSGGRAPIVNHRSSPDSAESSSASSKPLRAFQPES